MSAAGWALAIAVVWVIAVGPLLLGFAGFIDSRRGAGAEREPPHGSGKLTLLSALLYVLAFNLTFFIQEFFLVLPKAFLPGIQATLFHNNHAWKGEHPLVKLFQGTGALATVAAALVAAWLLRRGALRSTTARMFAVWMAYCGFFMALPQVVVGALSRGSDLGMAMDYLGLGETAKTAAALIALALIPAIAMWLTRALLELAAHPAQIATRRARTRFVFFAATLPALLATLPIFAFRVPREWIEVVVVPCVVTWIGVVWMQAGAWRLETAAARGRSDDASLARPLFAVLLLLLFFQCVLRPGIRFY